jgi:DNA polymerase eta
MRANEARSLCPEIMFFKTPQKYGKPYVRKYTEASEQIFDVILDFVNKTGNLITIEKASTDEVYLDITNMCKQAIEANDTYSNEFLSDLDVVVEGGKKKFLLSNRNDMAFSPLTHGAVLITDLCDEIFHETGYKSSAGISYNKLLAKIACGLNKPNRVTIIASKVGIARVFENIEIEDIPGLGAITGPRVRNTLNISTAKEMRRLMRKKLIRQFGRSLGVFLWDVARGIDKSPVIHKIYSKSISSSRSFFRGISKIIF